MPKMRTWTRSPAQHGLTALIAATPGLAEKVRGVEADRAHVIDLGTPLGDAWPNLAA
jgi:hypothetical protein